MKQEAVQQKVGDIMGGKVLDLPIIRVYHDGLAEGEAKGEAERAKLQEENDSLKKEIERLKASMSWFENSIRYVTPDVKYEINFISGVLD